jgi:DNA-binding protein HU-beta
MNKSQLVDALADRLGDRKTAATAVDALLQIVIDTVRSGDSVSLAGFGVFESRARAARTGRNPRTGESVAVPATTVPAFRPGTGFRSAVAGEAAAPAEADAPAPPRRRRSSRAVTTNGSGDGAALNGAVDLASVPTTTLLADPPATPADDKPAKAKKPSAKKAAAKKPDAKADTKKGKKGKKGK